MHFVLFQVMSASPSRSAHDLEFCYLPQATVNIFKVFAETSFIVTQSPPTIHPARTRFTHHPTCKAIIHPPFAHFTQYVFHYLPSTPTVETSHPVCIPISTQRPHCTIYVTHHPRSIPTITSIMSSTHPVMSSIKFMMGNAEIFNRENIHSEKEHDFLQNRHIINLIKNG